MKFHVNTQLPLDRIQSFLEAKSSALEPFGPAASMISDFLWIMLFAFAAIFLLVLVLLAAALLRKRPANSPEAPFGHTRFIALGGLLLPSLILLPLLIYTLLITRK